MESVVANRIAIHCVDSGVASTPDRPSLVFVNSLGTDLRIWDGVVAGLASRFAKTLEFENYGPDELVLIASRIARNDDYLLAPGVDEALLEWFTQIERDRNFGNAREARRLLEEVLAKHPEDGPALTTLGQLLAQAGRLEEAEPVLRRAARAQPNAYSPNWALYDCLNKRHKSAEARAQLAVA